VLQTFTPLQGQKLDACLKALKFALKNDRTKALLDSLERQKQTFELALLTLSMYSHCHLRSLIDRDLQIDEVDASVKERMIAQNERDENQAFRQCDITPSRTVTEGVVVQRTKEIMEWLHLGSFSERHRYIVSQRVENTGQWFLDAPEFKEWLDGNERRLLYCPGIGSTSSCSNC